MDFKTFMRGGTATTMAKNDWPLYTNEYFNALHIQKALRGDVSGLVTAFSWKGTPQGHSYWRHRRLEEKPMTQEDKDYLQFLLDTRDKL